MVEHLRDGASVPPYLSLPLGWFREEVPLFVPGMIVTVLVGLALARPVARTLKEQPWVTYLFIVALGFVLSATLTPLVGALETGATSSGTCDVSRLGPASIGTYARAGDASLNVLLFIPLGAVLSQFRGRRARVVIVASVLLPVAVEAVQMLVPTLGRGCETADVFDNTLGLLVGFALGWTSGRILAAVRPRSHAAGGHDERA